MSTEKEEKEETILFKVLIQYNVEFTDADVASEIDAIACAQQQIHSNKIDPTFVTCARIIDPLKFPVFEAIKKFEVSKKFQ